MEKTKMKKTKDLRKEVNILRTELKDSLKELRKLSKIATQYLDLAEKTGIPSNVDEAIKRVEEAKNCLDVAINIKKSIDKIYEKEK